VYCVYGPRRRILNWRETPPVWGATGPLHCHRALVESESPLTIQQFLSTLWRRKLIILVSMVVAVVAAVGYSKAAKPNFQSSALVQLNTGNQSTGQTSSSPVTFPNPVQELGSTAVQSEAAKILGGSGAAAVANDVTGTVDPTSGALTITASDSNPARAQAVAKAYSTAFTDQIQAIAQGQINKINSVVNQQRAQIAVLQAQPGSLTDTATTAQIASLNSAITNLETEILNIQVGEPYATVQVAAGFPGVPIGISTKKLALIGLLAGFLVGCGIALVLDQLDTRLRTSPELEALSEAPVLAELPRDSDVKSGKVVIAMVQAPQSLLAESVRELRTSLRVIVDETPCPTVVVTSPEAGDGKTFVAANLAAAWAMSGSKVVVVSGDFRRPRIEEIFGIEHGLPGLADVIQANWKTPEEDDAPDSGSARHSAATLGPPALTRDGRPRPKETSVSPMLVQTGIRGLYVLPAGTYLDNPAELFGSPGMQPVVDQLHLLADVVLIDTPPVLAVPDTAILGSLAHGAIVVATEGRTDRGMLERTIHRLEATHCRVLGLVLNRARHSQVDAYQAYAYRR
jgi:Mrp family chromosome partitioning ATPase/capsular polysaccharide biosynthesis protein